MNLKQRVALWDAIGRVVEASGGNNSNTSIARQVAIAEVERVINRVEAVAVAGATVAPACAYAETRDVPGGSVTRDEHGETFYPAGPPRTLYVLVNASGAQDADFDLQRLRGRAMVGPHVLGKGGAQIVSYVPRAWARQRLQQVLARADGVLREYAQQLGGDTSQ
jgi:hypothetical protein